MRPNELLLVIVPYRDRAYHLRVFLRDVWSRLRRIHGNTTMKLLVAQQSNDNRLFNRGAVLNAAVDFALHVLRWEPARIIFHDVDLIPCARLMRLYRTMPLRCAAVAYGQRWGRYPGRHFFGGVCGVCPFLFEQVGGFPSIWGWGGEDDGLLRRIRHAGVRLTAPRVGHYRDLEECNMREKLHALRKHDLMSTREARQAAKGSLRDLDYHIRDEWDEDTHKHIVIALEPDK